MNEQQNHKGFVSKIGLVLATAGAAVGLGNIWRFPTTTGQNGGAAFILVYVLFTLVLCVPGMVAEFIVGRNGACAAKQAYAKAGGKKAWGLLGIIGMIACSVILGFYNVIAGWTLYYLGMAVGDQVLGDPEHVAEGFGAMMSSMWIPSVMGILFMLLTHGIIVRGVQNGIEKASKIMMPLFFVLLIVLIFAGFTLPGAWKGVEFLFKPDFSKVTADVMFEALGQAFFSLSLGAACLCTYASYFRKDVNLISSTAQIVGIDMSVAILAGLMVFPAVFAVGVEPNAGPGLVFMTLPNVFYQAFPYGVAYVVSVLFYALLALAALTSTISLHEIGTAVIAEEFKMDRKYSAWIITVLCSIITVLSALSLGPVEMGFFGMTLFDNFDSFASNMLLPLGAFCTCILVGWVMKRETVVEQLTSGGLFPRSGLFINTFFFLVRFVCPIFIVAIFMYKMGVL